MHKNITSLNIRLILTHGGQKSNIDEIPMKNFLSGNTFESCWAFCADLGVFDFGCYSLEEKYENFYFNFSGLFLSTEWLSYVLSTDFVV